MIGKIVTLPDLTKGNVVSDSIKDTESIRIIVETINNTTLKLRESEMQGKLKKCQRIQTRSNQHQ